MTAPTDIDLHGLAGIRLLEATEEDTRTVARQLGMPLTTLKSEPDLVIRFVDRLQSKSSIRYLGLDDAGFTEDAFLVLRSKHKSRALVQIPFHSIGKPCEIICERGLLQVPLLIPILNLTILSKGALPLHAAAFTYEGIGIVATGWSKGGKTETLLSFMENGASYIGDEWIYISGDGSRMVGIPEPIRVWDWHLAQLPRCRGLVRWTDRVKIQALALLAGGIGRITTGRPDRMPSPLRNLNRLHSLLRKQLCIDIPPQELFGPEACQLSGIPGTILFLVSQDTPEVTVRPIDPHEVAGRVVSSLQHEQLNFISYYLKFRFAFPDLANELIENSRDIQAEILNRVVQGKEAFEVCHPYPVAISSLFQTIRDRCLRM